MGRTPLFRLLQRAAAIARASRHVVMPLDEFHDVQRAHRVDRRRRRLLQGAGASALLAGCGTLPAPMRGGKDDEVVIVGAGIAGLTKGASMSDLAYPTTWDTTRKQPGSGGVLTNFTGGRHGVQLGQGTPKQQADAASRDLDRVFSGIAAARGSAREARFHCPSHPWSLGSYACLRPGDWSSLRGVMGESVGGLHFAGEHCALETQGFMEGGCESGELAARSFRNLASCMQSVGVFCRD